MVDHYQVDGAGLGLAFQPGLVLKSAQQERSTVDSIFRRVLDREIEVARKAGAINNRRPSRLARRWASWSMVAFCPDNQAHFQVLGWLDANTPGRRADILRDSKGIGILRFGDWKSDEAGTPEAEARGGERGPGGLM
jgi:hypothetical protein